MDENIYEVRVEKGIQQLYFKGQKLPNQTLSVVKQDVDLAMRDKAMCEITITVLAILKDTKG